MIIRKPVSINKRITAFYTELHKIALVYCEACDEIPPPCIKNKPKHRVIQLHVHICEVFYGEIEDMGYLKQVKKAATKCGLKFAGAGRSRMVVTTVYYSKKIAIKLSVRGRNEKELQGAVNMSKGFKKVAIVPAFQWDNELWGLVLAFPYSPIINKGEWDVWNAKDEEWAHTRLPKMYQNKAFARQLRVISRYTRDAHPFNIGIVNRKPYLIDYDVS